MNIAISWADVSTVKKAAKAAKKSSGLSLMQNQNLLAHQMFGVRDFHELQKHYSAQVAKNVSVVGGLHKCGFCRFNFDGSLGSDVKQHLERHGHFEDAQKGLTFLPHPYSMREALKKAGHDHMGRRGLADQRRGALLILVAWFDRSLENAINRGEWHQHPCFKTYIAMAITDDEVFPAKIRAKLAAEFGRMPGHLESGHTDWHPKSKKICTAEDIAASLVLRRSAIEVEVLIQELLFELDA